MSRASPASGRRHKNTRQRPRPQRPQSTERRVESEERNARPGINESDCISLTIHSNRAAAEALLPVYVFMKLQHGQRQRNDQCGTKINDRSRPAIQRMKLPRIKIGRPQRLAALLLLLFLAECLWVVSHQQLSTAGLPLRRVRPRDVGAPFAAGRLLHHLRQSQRRRHLRLSRCGASAHRPAASHARR